MIEIRRSPGGGAVAGAAFRCRGDVRCSFAHCLGSIVAAGAGPDHVIVADGLGRAPCRGGVAIGAGVAGAKVRGALAGRIGSIVAAGAGPRKIRVIEIGRSPTGGCMAGAAISGRRDMGCCLTARFGPVVTAGAGADHVVVVHGFRWSPSVGCVAIGAGITGIEMGRAFARGAGSIMAAGTCPSSI